VIARRTPHCDGADGDTQILAAVGATEAWAPFRQVKLSGQAKRPLRNGFG